MLGGTISAYATTGNTTTAPAATTNKSVTVEQQKNQVNEQDQTKENDENGVIVYGVEVKTGNAVHDVKVDAITGAILKSDQDNDKEDNGKIEKDSKESDNDNIQHENENEDSSNHED